MRRLESLAVGLSLALLVVGASLIPLTQPFFTRQLSQRFSLVQEAGLSPERMLEVAEQVRAFVASPGGTTLPTTVDGRPGFDEAAVSHLADVRSVIFAAAVFTAGLALLLGVWLALRLSRRQFDRLASALWAGAVACLVFVLLMGGAGLFDFDSLFTAFHGVFFAEGTWTFSYDSLLIQTFPETFWVAAGVAWAGLIVLGGVLLGVASRWAKAVASKADKPLVRTHSAKGA